VYKDAKMKAYQSITQPFKIINK